MTQLVLITFHHFSYCLIFDIYAAPLLLEAAAIGQAGTTRRQTLPAFQPGGKASQYLQNDGSYRRGGKNLDKRHFYSQPIPE